MRESYRYSELAEELHRRIQRGLYPIGKRLPGVRRLGRQFQVSVSTVLEALHRLEERGVVEARPRSGYFVRNITRAPAPTTPEPPRGPSPVTGQEMVLRLVQAANDPRFVQLGAAVPDPSFLPRQALRRAMNTVYREHADRAMDYIFPPGSRRLRELLARRMTELGTPLDPEGLVITDGCQEAVLLALRAATRPGDVVAVESPTYYGLLQALEAGGLQALEIPTDPREGLNLQVLAFALEQWPVRACIVTTNFSNPLGGSLSTARKQDLVRLLDDHGVPLVEDDVYGDLPHSGPRPDTAKAYDRNGNVLYCASYSKTLSPGLRVGWIAAGRFHDRVQHLKYVSNLAAPAGGQLAIADLLARGAYERHLRDVRAAYARSTGRMLHLLENVFPEGTRMTHPQGGFLIWVQLPPGADAMTVHARARAEGISVAPGPIFSASGKYADCLRLTTAVPWSATLERALVRLGQLAGGA